ncbi:MAG: thioredoxin family protein [Planctomycetota bacterium]
MGASAPDFELPATDGATVRLSDFKDAPGLLVAFICNHCPFVQHLRVGFADFAREYAERGLAVVAINANDVVTHPEDDPAAMAREVEAHDYGFPYLFDESQEVAKAYRAACTPDFFLFDRHGKLAYRGQFDGSRPGNDVPVTGEDLRAAADAVLESREPSREQPRSIGCNIKWKAGNEPEWFPG